LRGSYDVAPADVYCSRIGLILPILFPFCSQLGLAARSSRARGLSAVRAADRSDGGTCKHAVTKISIRLRNRPHRGGAAGIARASHLTQVIIRIAFAKTAPMGCRKGVGTAWHFRSLSRAGTACRLPSGPRSWNWCGVAESHYTGWRLEELYLPPENQASWSSRAGTGRSIPWRLRNSL
jgi:hypothetical protein